MAQDFLVIPLPSAFDVKLSELSAVLDTAEASDDGRRIVILGAVNADFLANRTQASAGKVKRPYAVHAVRGTDGAFRTWFVSSRDAARKLKKAYQEDGGSATVQDTRKDV